ncbi:MAG: UbiD family decarboxylase [Rhodospirillaceae bacterium]|nr:UbiD family decarboxylase [Rhodospirillaceae bacterium]MDE0619581.1 UbiD family decarboxylase [Rhodospirillaceae bacterium]
MRAYLDSLRAAGDLHVVRREVDPKHELAAVTAAFQKRHYGAILFETVRGAPMPVVSNVYGSRRRLCALIGAPDLAFCPAWDRLVARAPERAELQEGPADRRRIALSELPHVTYFEKDAGPYITAGILLAKHPETGVPNLSFHRAMHVSDGELRIRIGSSHDLTRYQRAAEAKGEALEAAMLLGAAPEIFLAACASIPPDADELAVANAVAGGPIAVTPCETVGLSVPADTQIVVEGRILPHERRPEGPFGEFMGYYVPEEDNHVFEVTAVTACADPVYHALVCGSPEDLIPLETAIASKIYRHLTALLPGIVDVSCNPQLLNTVVKINKQYEGHARHVLLAAFGAHMDYSKTCMVTDEDVDIHDLNDVWWAFVTRGRADTRSLVVPDVPGFYRDPHKDHWGRLGIDATKPWGREAEFERKRIPGGDAVDLAEWLR